MNPSASATATSLTPGPDQTSNSYYDWFMYHAYFIYAAQAGAAKFVETFKEFPPIQKPGSFTIDEAIAKMGDASAGSS